MKSSKTRLKRYIININYVSNSSLINSISNTILVVKNYTEVRYF